MLFQTNIHLVITIEHNDQYFAFWKTIKGGNNLWIALKTVPYIYSANVCTSKKDAQAFAELWNEGFKRDGTYMNEYPCIQR